MAGNLWATRLASHFKISLHLHNRGFASATFSKLKYSFEVIKDLKYAESHEWVKVEGNLVTIGITDHAQDHLGNIVFVELPDEGAAVKQGAGFGTVDSVKSTGDMNSPVSGKVVEVNTELTGSPGLGWIIKVEMNNVDEVKSLMDAEEYSQLCEKEENAKY